MADEPEMQDPKMGPRKVASQQLDTLCAGKWPPGHTLHRQINREKLLKKGTSQEDIEALQSVYDEAEARIHQVHLTNIKKAGDPEPRKQARYKEYCDELRRIESQRRRRSRG